MSNETRNIKSHVKYEAADIITNIYDLRTGNISAQGTFKVISCHDSSSAYMSGAVYELKITKEDEK